MPTTCSFPHRWHWEDSSCRCLHVKDSDYYLTQERDEASGCTATKLRQGESDEAARYVVACVWSMPRDTAEEIFIYYMKSLRNVVETGFL